MRWSLVVRSASAAAIACALAGPVRAQDEFEIQVYDVETAHQGEPGLEVHLNQHLIHAAPDETHLTLEPHYGLAEWAELGGYLQFAMTTTGDFAFAGAKLRMKLRWPRRVWDDRIGLAINFELSVVPARFEPNVYGSEIRPIADLRVGRLYAAVNPIGGTDLGGTYAGRPQLEPAAKLAVVATDRVMVGVEGYGAFGPVDALGEDERVERAFGVVDVRGGTWDLNAGVGVSHGNGDHPVAKLIFGVHPRD